MTGLRDIYLDNDWILLADTLQVNPAGWFTVFFRKESQGESIRAVGTLEALGTHEQLEVDGSEALMASIDDKMQTLFHRAVQDLVRVH